MLALVYFIIISLPQATFLARISLSCNELWFVLFAYPPHIYYYTRRQEICKCLHKIRTFLPFSFWIMIVREGLSPFPFTFLQPPFFACDSEECETCGCDRNDDEQGSEENCDTRHFSVSFLSCLSLILLQHRNPPRASTFFNLFLFT